MFEMDDSLRSGLPQLEHPLVSVIVPVFNGEAYLAEAIGSVLSQDYPWFELIVIDDGSASPQGVSAICDAFKDGRLRLIRKHNGGVSSALNLGVAEARGRYFAWLSHDDRFLPGKLLEQVNLIQASQDPSRTIIFSNYRLMDEHGTLISRRRLERDLSKCVSRLGPIERGLVNGCTVLMELETLRSLGPFNESLRCTQDFDMWIRAAAQNIQFCFQSRETVSTRLHRDQASRTAPSVVEENEQLWRRIALLVIADLRSVSPVRRTRGLHHFLEFLRSAVYLAGCDLSEVGRAVQHELAEAAPECPRLLGALEQGRHRATLLWIAAKREIRAIGGTGWISSAIQKAGGRQ